MKPVPRASCGVLIGIPCLLRGGTEQQTLQLVRAGRDAFKEVTVCCYFEQEPTVGAEFAQCGAKVLSLGLHRDLSAVRVIHALRRAFKQQRPSLVHVQYMAPGFLAVLAARLAGVPRVIATVHQPATPYGRKAKWLLRAAARMCDRFICVSEAAERSWFGDAWQYDAPRGEARNGDAKRKHCTIHNAIDLDRINAVLTRTESTGIRADLGWEQNLILGTVSRLRHEKGVDVLLDAFAAVAKRVPLARLLVVGDGPDGEKLKCQARKLGIEPLLHWAGKQPWERAMQFMAAMDVVVVPSRFEGFGLAAAEAMACSKPVIASDVDGLSEVIGQDGSGQLFETGNATDLCNQLFRFTNPHLREQIGKRARDRVAAHFSAVQFRTRTLSLYREVLNACDRPQSVVPSL